MKKLVILFLGFFSFIGSTYALNFDFVGDMSSFRRGVGLVELNPIEITIENDSEITSSGFSLILNDQSTFRFYQTQKLSITLTGISSEVVVNPSLKQIDFESTVNLKKGDKFIISGLKAFIYRSSSSESRQIGLKTFNNIYWSNGNIRINDLPILSLDLSSSEVFNLTGTINKIGNLLLTADNPSDPDFGNIEVSFFDKNMTKTYSTLLNSLNNYELTFGNADYLVVKTLNNRGIYSTGITHPISYFDPNFNNQTTNPGSNSIISTGTTNIGTEINSGSVLIEKLALYNPLFNKYKTSLDKFVIVMDKYINSKIKVDLSIYQENQIITIRNEIAKIAELLDKSKISERKQILIDLKSKITELKNKLK